MEINTFELSWVECWLIINWVLQYSHERTLTGRLQENDIFEIIATFSRGQWVNSCPFYASDELSMYAPPINGETYIFRYRETPRLARE